MSHIRTSTNKTSVKFLINTVAALTVIFSGFVALAADAAPAATTSAGDSLLLKALNNAGTDPCLTDPNSVACKGNNCHELQKNANDAATDMGTLCSDAGLDSTCVSKALACKTIEKEKTYDSSGQMTQSVTQMANAYLQSQGISIPTSNTNTKTGATNTCSTYTGKTYADQKKELKDEINKANEDIASAQTQLAEDQASSAKDISQMQKDILDQKKEASTKKDGLSDSLRESISSFMQNQQKTSADISSKTATVIQLQGKLVASQRTQAMGLAQLNDDAMAASCQNQAQETYKSFQTMAAKGSISFNARKGARQQALNQYRDCMTQLAQKRQALIEQARTEQAALQQQIISARQESADLQTSLDSLQSNLNDITTQNTASKSEADKDLLTAMQNTQTDMQSAQATSLAKQKASQTKIMTLQSNLSKATNDLTTLEDNPAPESSTIATSAVGGKLKADSAKIVDYTEACCIEELKDTPYGKSAMCKQQKYYKDVAEGNEDAAMEILKSNPPPKKANPATNTNGNTNAAAPTATQSLTPVAPVPVIPVAPVSPSKVSPSNGRVGGGI